MYKEICDGEFRKWNGEKNKKIKHNKIKIKHFTDLNIQKKNESAVMFKDKEEVIDNGTVSRRPKLYEKGNVINNRQSTIKFKKKQKTFLSEVINSILQNRSICSEVINSNDYKNLEDKILNILKYVNMMGNTDIGYSVRKQRSNTST